MKNLFRLSLIGLFALLVGAVTWQSAYAGAADPDVGDTNFCGRDGAVTQAQTIRWTDVFSAPDPDANIGQAFAPNTAVTIEGRDYWGCWVKITAGSVSGWLPVDSLNTRAVMGLPVLFDNSGGKCIKDGVICGAATTPTQPDARFCGTAGADTTARTTRWTDVFRVPDPDSNIGVSFAPSTAVTIEGRDHWGCWVKIMSGATSGWLPVDALTTRAVMGLPVLFDNSGGKCVKDGVICAAGATGGTPAPDPGGRRFCGTPGNETSARTIRWTNIYAGPDAATVTPNAFAPNTGVTMEGRDYWGCWAKIANSGWLPVDALSTQAIMGLPVLVDNR